MSPKSPSPPDADPASVPNGGSPKRGKTKLLLLGLPALLVAGLAGAWFAFIGPKYFGRHLPATPNLLVAHAPAVPVYADLPDVIANLSSSGRRESFIKLKAKLELARASDQAAVAAGMPRLLDLFQTYLREMRPEELRGSAGTYRLREELIARANIALAPAQVIDVLFVEMLVQ